MDIFFILILSVPVFYVFGIISFIRWLIRENNTPPKESDRTFLNRIVSELSEVAATAPDTTVKMLLDRYAEKLHKVQLSLPAKQTTTASSVIVTHDQTGIAQTSVHAGKDFSFSNWYSNNSINLLLYLGAFLIVMSAVIFIGFQWETLSGVIKAILLTCTALAFSGFGVWFFSIPKIRNAGSTFMSIGALLIPLCGAAWYTFVFKAMSVDAGLVWLITSVISFSVYIILATRYKNIFYVYISNFATLSFSLAIVNTLNLANEFYILASIFTSFVLFIVGTENKQYKDLLNTPYLLSSQVLMPISLVYGLLVAIDGDKLFTAEAVVSVFLGVLYYVLAYTQERASWKLLLAQILLPLALSMMAKWIGFNDELLLLLITLCGFGYLLLTVKLQEQKLTDEANQSHVLGIFLIIIPFLLALIWNLPPQSLLLFALLPVLAGIVEAVLQKDFSYTGIATFFFAISLYIFHHDVLEITEAPQQLGLAYTALGLFYFTALVFLRQQKQLLLTLAFSSSFFFLLGFLFTITHYPFLALVAIVIAIVFFLGSREFVQPSLIYPSNCFLYLALFTFLMHRNTAPATMLLYFTLLPFALYGISVAFELKDKASSQAYRLSALGGSALLPLLSFTSFSSWYGDKLYQRNELLSFYALTLLSGLDAYIKKQPKLYYATSAAAMITYCWHLGYRSVSEELLYILPIGIYFLVLAYTRRMKKDYSTMQLLDYLGMLFLVVIPFFFSFGSEQIKYSLIVGLSGLVLLMLGNSFSYKLYRFAGFAGVVLAVLPQTYEYILSLPRWVVVGLIGLGLLGTAITLLLRRKEH